VLIDFKVTAFLYIHFMKALKNFIFIFILLLPACEPNDPETDTPACEGVNRLSEIDQRNFGMGFTTWPYDASSESVDDTYSFLSNNATIYAEHLDNRIPWNAWINNEPLPEVFVNDVNSRKQKRLNSPDLLLSVSILNNARSGLIEDFQGNLPDFDQLDDPVIENAYVAHLTYLIEELSPDYLLISIESNELLLNAPDQWEAFKRLMQNVKERIGQLHPNIPLSESVTLHNWYSPNVSNPLEFISEISEYVSNYEFAAISFYPFFKGLKTTEDFQLAFDFLHEQTNQPIAFVETAMIAENLEVSALNVSIAGDECEQRAYLESLMFNAQEQDYKFIIWWAHRDYDQLWDTFDESVKDLGKIWRDTGLLDEDGNERPGFELWKELLAL
jgi:hypothetical protein